MKKKNGFTLIELLAVIIILGILMIIAIPSVTSYINNSRKSAYVDSAREIIAGARNFVNEGKVPMYDTSATYYIKSSCISTENGQKSPYGDFVDDETYVIVTYDGKGYDYYWVSRDTTGQGVPTPTSLKDLNEDDIKSDIVLGTIIPTKISDDKSNVQVINSTCNGFEEPTIDITTFATLPTGKTKKEDLVVGDLVKIGNEEFYVVSNDTTNDELTLLAHYNLNVGSLTKETTKGVQDSEVKGWVENSYNGYYYGRVSFSNNSYWNGKLGTDYLGNYCNNGTNMLETKCAFVYYDKNNKIDSNNKIAAYVDAYKEYLETKGAIIKDARLLKVEEAYILGCRNWSCSDSNSSAPSWIYETSYWLGSANSTYVWIIDSNGLFGSRVPYEDSYSGVRPVIVI